MLAKNAPVEDDNQDVLPGINIVKFRSMYEVALKDSKQFADAEFDDVLALIQQDVALGTQLRALSSISEINSSGLSDVLLKFEIWWNNYSNSEPGSLSEESHTLMRSIHEDLIRIASAKK